MIKKKLILLRNLSFNVLNYCVNSLTQVLLIKPGISFEKEKEKLKNLYNQIFPTFLHRICIANK